MNTLKPTFELHCPTGAPVYEPKLWRKNSGHINCYAYALNILNKGWARPGQLLIRDIDRVPVESKSPMGLRRLIERDGLVLLDDFNTVSDDHHVIAGFANIEQGDYHFYRRDRGGTWSHKMSFDPVSSIDCDPVLAASKDYFKHFIGCFLVPDEGVPFAPSAYF